MMQDADEPGEQAANNQVSDEKPKGSKKARGKCCTLLGLMLGLEAEYAAMSSLRHGYGCISWCAVASVHAVLLMSCTA